MVKILVMSWAVLTLPCTPLSGRAQDQQGDGNEGLNATLWMQKAHEYAFSAEQVYRFATTRLRAAKVSGNALLPPESTTKPTSKQPAIILDLDETVLDNSPFQGAVVTRIRYFKSEEWNAWLATEAADAVPGAKEFLVAAAKLGFRIFYVTNRECDKNTAPVIYPHPNCANRQHTTANLRKLGLPFADDPNALLMRYDQQDWGDGKSARRRFIGRTHRVAMLFGDDLGDFVPVSEEQRIRLDVPADRRVSYPGVAASAPYQAWVKRFGLDWFVLPNASYGSWETGLGRRPACQEATPPKSGDDCYVAALSRKRTQLVAMEVSPRQDLKLAAWNLAWLMTPETYDALSATCGDGQASSDSRAIPCPNAKSGPHRRSASDFAVLHRYAVRLDADVVALSEVDGPAAGRLVFRDHALECFVSRAHPQKTGFAIRRGIPYRCNPEYLALDTNGALRAGADVTLFPGSTNEVRLLAVHLKSGCFEEPLDDTANRACESLRNQIPALEHWIDARAAEGVAFAVLGDFNRELELESGATAGADESRPLTVYPALDDRIPANLMLHLATAGQSFVPCRPGDKFTAYIDHIIIDGRLRARSGPPKFVRLPYEEADAQAAVLSDHCPVGVVLPGALR